jgi:hypothetical protein
MDPKVVAPPMKAIFWIYKHSKGWKNAQELTATGPSGLTFFSHFITATFGLLLASIDAAMTNIPYTTEYLPLP